MKKSSLVLGLFIISIFFMACNGGNKVKVSKIGEKLMSHAWKLQPNESIKANTDSLKDSTNITADIQLKGDVKKIADFMAETLQFARDKKNPQKLAYSSKIGKGMLSIKTLGYWNLSDDNKTLTLRKWDSNKKQEMTPVDYKIVELSDTKLVLKNKQTGAVKIYFAK